MAVALVLAGIAYPACAQHHSAGGFSGGHSAPVFHGGFRGSAAPRPAYAPRSSHFRPAPGFRSTVPPGSGAWRGGIDGRRHRPVYISPYRYGYGYGYPIAVPWIGPGYLGYPDTFDEEDDDSQDTAGAPPGVGYDTGGEEYGEPGGQYLGPWPSQPAGTQATQRGQALAPTGEQRVTLVFKDGRPSMQIQNYILTPNAIFVQDARRAEIPLDLIDLAATEKVNEEAGVEFRLPQALNQ
jgi:hypothetical protein